MSAVVLLTAVFIALAWRPFRSWVRNDLAPAIDEYRVDGRVARFVEIARRARPNALVKRSAVVDSRAA